MSTRPGHALLLIFLTLGGYIMLADFFNLRQARVAGTSEDFESEMPWPQPWGGYGKQALLIAAGDDWIISPDVIAALIQEASPQYPLDAEQWLNLAQINIAEGNFQPVVRLLEKAIAIRPLHRPTLFTSVQIALQTGDQMLAERQIQRWLQLHPQGTEQALFIGRRWISDPGDLLERMLPPEREYLEAAMQVALGQNDLALAGEVWKRLEPKPVLNDPTFLQYIELLLDKGEVAQAETLWAGRDPNWRQGMLANGDFERELGESLGLNWRRNSTPSGVLIERDLQQSHSPPASLKIAFNGNENVNLARPWIRIPVEPGGKYRFSGFWRAEAMTTRALPYLQLSAEGSRFQKTVAVPNTEFEWQEWSIEFTVPAASQLIRLAVRRNSTRAFDRNIDGTLWLDDFRLELITEPEAAQSTAFKAPQRQATEKEKGSIPTLGFTDSIQNKPASESATAVGAGLAGDDVDRNSRTSSALTEAIAIDPPAWRLEAEKPKLGAKPL